MSLTGVASILGPLGKKYRIYIESEDGEVYEFPAISATVSFIQEVGSFMQTEIILRGYDKPQFYTRDRFIERVGIARITPEWVCDWCRRPNQRHDETCKSCGAVRSFIYED